MNKVILICVLVAAMIAANASAQNIIGVSPADINLKNVLRGGYSERYVTISLTSEEKVKMNIEPRGEIKAWLNFSEITKNVSGDSPWRLLLSVTPPFDVPNGNYTGFIRVSSESISKGGEDGHAVGMIYTTVDIAVTVEVVDKEEVSCRASNFEVKSAEKGDNIWFSIAVANEGNVRLRPQVSATIWNAEQTGIVKTINYTGDEIFPTKEGRVEFKVMTNDLDIGQYWIDVTALECFESTTLTFDVLEEGALRADGRIRGIFTKTWADIDETIPILVVFGNTGEKEVNAQFRGKVSYGEDIKIVLESPKEDVKIGEQGNFTFYFTPKKKGKYVVSGRVFYDNKRTFESSAVINVNPGNITLRNLIVIFAYILMGVLMFVLLYKIKSEKTRYLDKLRRFGNG